MQPTEQQVERSLAALLRGAETAPAEPRIDEGLLGAAPMVAVEVPVGLAEALDGAPDVRADRLAAARRRLAQGEAPSDEELAGRMVGRIVCDRLR